MGSKSSLNGSVLWSNKRRTSYPNITLGARGFSCPVSDVAHGDVFPYFRPPRARKNPLVPRVPKHIIAPNVEQMFDTRVTQALKSKETIVTQVTGA